MIRSMISSQVRSMITSMVNPGGGGAEQRVFIDNDNDASAFYSLDTAIVCTDDFSVKFKFASSVASASSVCGGASGASHITINTDLTIRIRINNASTLSSVVTGIDDGKLHEGEFVRTGSGGELFIDGISFEVFGSVNTGTFTIDFIAQQNGFTRFNGILADFSNDNNGTITSWNLDEETASTETSNQGGSDLTYQNQALAKRELFELSGGQTQWDNISPPVQQLPAVIEIA